MDAIGAYRDQKVILKIYACIWHWFIPQRPIDEQEELLEKSATLYVGNLSFYTKEEQIYELFMMCGDVKRVIMGLDRNNHTPCGFCFVE